MTSFPIYPTSLATNDKIAITSPAGAVRGEYIDGACKVLESWGFAPCVMPHARGRFGTYSGTLAERTADLKNALFDTDIRAILCARGGYGAVQMLEHISSEEISKNQKWLIGFSDISALHAAWAAAGVVSLHAPMCKHLAISGADDDYSLMLFRVLTGTMPIYNVKPHSLNRLGNASGTLIGGNMAVIGGLICTPWDIYRHKDMILFIEDISEPLYKVERMMYQLRLSGVLESLRGLLVGQFTNYEPSAYEDIPQMIHRMIKGYDFPVVFDFPVGHVRENVTLMENSRVHLSVTESGAELKFEAR